MHARLSLSLSLSLSLLFSSSCVCVFLFLFFYILFLFLHVFRYNLFTVPEITCLIQHIVEWSLTKRIVTLIHLTVSLNHNRLGPFLHSSGFFTSRS